MEFQPIFPLNNLPVITGFYCLLEPTFLSKDPPQRLRWSRHQAYFDLHLSQEEAIMPKSDLNII